MGTKSRLRRVIVVIGFSALSALSAVPAAQVSFEATTRDLASPDASVRLKAVRLLKDAAYPEAAEPLAPLIGDADDTVQFEAIGAELNIFLAEKVTSKRRVGYIVEVRNRLAADAVFDAGPLALTGQPVPLTVLSALRGAIRDDNPTIGLEALYAFGALAPEAAAVDRPDLLRASAPDLASLIGASSPALRLAGVRAIGRVFQRRPQDPAIDASLGDALILALNDDDRAVRQAAMRALGALRYERAVDALTTLYRYYGRGDDGVAALEGLAGIAHPSSTDLFVSQLTAKDAAARAAAVEGLARLGDGTKLTTIQAADGSDRSDVVQLAVQFASARLSHAPLEPIVNALAQPRLRDRAFMYLTELAPARARTLATTR